jgi:hypothetical protein
MGYQTRTPTSNDMPRRDSGNPWLDEDDLVDETFLLLSRRARRCVKCRRACMVRHLQDGECPDCRKQAEPVHA